MILNITSKKENANPTIIFDAYLTDDDNHVSCFCVVGGDFRGHERMNRFFSSEMSESF